VIPVGLNWGVVRDPDQQARQTWGASGLLAEAAQRSRRAWNEEAILRMRMTAAMPTAVMTTR